MCSGIADIAVAETGGADAGTDRTSSDTVDVEANGVVLLVEVLYGQLINSNIFMYSVMMGYLCSWFEILHKKSKIMALELHLNRDTSEALADDLMFSLFSFYIVTKFY